MSHFAAADLVGLLIAAGNVETGTAAGGDVAQSDQPVVGLDHGEAADRVLVGKAANRRQAHAGAQDAVVDMAADAADNLVDQGHR